MMRFEPELPALIYQDDDTYPCTVVGISPSDIITVKMSSETFALTGREAMPHANSVLIPVTSPGCIELVDPPGMITVRTSRFVEASTLERIFRRRGSWVFETATIATDSIKWRNFLSAWELHR